MSLPKAQLPGDSGGSNPNKDEAQSSTRPKPETSTSREAAKNEFRVLIASLLSPADGKCFDDLGSDGVWRVLQWLPTPPDQPTGIKVYDAKPMSPEMIKVHLDTQPWSKAVEDRFRGVDGRAVPQE